MYQWSIIEEHEDSYIRCLGVYDKFEEAVAQTFITINDTIDDHFYNDPMFSDDYKISKLCELEVDAGYVINLKVNQTQSGNAAMEYNYYLLCSEKG
jgi:hypothetical protein